MKEKMEKSSFLLLLVLVSLAFIFLLRPFSGIIFWACTLGLLFYPCYAFLHTRKNLGKNVSALLTVLLCMVVFVAPAIFIFISFFNEVSSFYTLIKGREFNPALYFDQITHSFPFIQDAFTNLNIDVDALRQKIADFALGLSSLLAQYAVSIGSDTLGFVTDMAMMLYVFFFMLRDGEALIEVLIRALPLGDERERMLFAQFSSVTRATVKGSLVVAIVQGLLGGVAFSVLGVQGAVLWGTVMTVLSLVPVVGSALVWGPVALYFCATGLWWKGIALTLFGVCVIGLIDNILRPILVGKDTKLPDYLILLSTLGGFMMFGFSGFIVGPLIAVLFITFWHIFIRDFNS